MITQKSLVYRKKTKTKTDGHKSDFWQNLKDFISLIKHWSLRAKLIPQCLNMFLRLAGDPVSV